MMNPEQIAAAAAADIAEAERLSAAHSQLAHFLGVAIIAATLFVAGYCGGGAHQRQVTLAAHADSVRKVAKDTIKVSQQAEAVDSAGVARSAVRKTFAHDSATLAAYRDSLATARAAAGHVRVLNDSTVMIHDTIRIVPPAAVVQLEDDAAALKAKDDHIAKQDTEFAAATAWGDSLQIQLTATQHERDGWKITAQVDAAQLAVSQPKHRFGFKSGLAVGAAIVLGILHFAK